MEYIGSPGSVTYLHIELNGLHSVNIMLAGEPKIWLIVEPKNLKHLSQAIERKIEEIGELFDSGKNNSYRNRRAVHKPGFIYDLVELEGLGVKYSLIYQEVGDLVFIGCDVPHEVLNSGFNLADAKLIQHPNLLTFERLLRCQWNEALPQISTRCENPPGHFVRNRVTVDMGTQTEETLVTENQEIMELKENSSREEIFCSQGCSSTTIPMVFEPDLECAICDGAHEVTACPELLGLRQLRDHLKSLPTVSQSNHSSPVVQESSSVKVNNQKIMQRKSSPWLSM